MDDLRCLRGRAPGGGLANELDEAVHGGEIVRVEAFHFVPPAANVHGLEAVPRRDGYKVAELVVVLVLVVVGKVEERAT